MESRDGAAHQEPTRHPGHKHTMRNFFRSGKHSKHGKHGKKPSEEAPLLVNEAPNEDDSADSLRDQLGGRSKLQEIWHWLLDHLMMVIIILSLIGGVIVFPSSPSVQVAASRAASEILENMSPNYEHIDPCTQFDKYVCEGFEEKHDLRSDQSSLSTGTLMAENAQQVLRHVLESPLSTKGADATSPSDREIFGKLQDAYNACMDEQRLKNIGSAPLIAVLHQLEAHFPTKGQHNPKEGVLFPQLHPKQQLGMTLEEDNQLSRTVTFLSKFGVASLVAIGVGADDKDPDTVVPFVMAPRQPGLPSKEYYQDPKTLVRYGQVIGEVLEALLAKAGPNSTISSMASRFRAQSAELVESIVGLESKLAKATPDTEDAEDVTFYYNPLTFSEVKILLPQLPIQGVISSLAPHAPQPAKLIVESPLYLKTLAQLLKETSPETLQAYFVWKVVQTYAYKVEDDALKPLKRFGNELLGKDPEAREERWRTCVNVADHGLGWILSRFFIGKAFSEGAKQFGDQIVSNIKVQFIENLKNAEWMSKEVRQLGIAKVHAIVQKIGYPTKSPNVRDASDLKEYYKNLNITSTTFFGNELSVAEFDTRRQWSALGQPTNRDEWGMTADTVNAYYNPPGNEIVFPAGIMQKPVFYDPRVPQYLSYGAFGAVSGHELSHAFDSTGRHYDETGNFTDWWDDDTVQAFREKAQCFIDQYEDFTVANPSGEPLHVNGRLTLGENIADAGGLNAAFAAWKKIEAKKPSQSLPGLQHFTKEQMFFISYSNWWCGKVRPETAVNAIYRDPHAPIWARILKSWNVYNAENIARVKRDEAEAAAREEADEQRMQEADAERRLQILRGNAPVEELESVPTVLGGADENGRRSRDHEERGSGRGKKRRRIAGEDDTERDIRYALEDGALEEGKKSEGIRLVSRNKSDAPLIDRTGHINLFPAERAKGRLGKNAEAEAEKATKEKELEDQYTMRFANAAGFKRSVGEKPWYHSLPPVSSQQQGGKEQRGEVVLGKDVWGNEDPGRREREKMRVAADDPLAAIKKGVAGVREVEHERKNWRVEKERDMRALEEDEKRRGRPRKKRRRSEEALDGFRLDVDVAVYGHGRHGRSSKDSTLYVNGLQSTSANWRRHPDTARPSWAIENEIWEIFGPFRAFRARSHRRWVRGVVGSPAARGASRCSLNDEVVLNVEWTLLVRASTVMAPTADFSKPFGSDGRISNPIKRAWKEDRIDISPILLGRGQGKAPTARHDLEQVIYSSRKSSERARSRGRHSLRHVKNSTDVLRQRSLKRANKESATDTLAGTREGRNFTVANIGNNGKIYLRPTARLPQSHQPPPPAYPFAPPLGKQRLESDLESLDERKRWSDTQTSRTPTRYPRATSTESRTRRSNSISGRSSKLSRSDSMSTLGADHTSEQGAYRVVINNGTSSPQEPVQSDLPTIEVPIPHYRLGTPRFSTRGTAFLHSAVYSRASTAENLEPSVISAREFDSLFPIAPGMEAEVVMSRIQSQQVPPPLSSKGPPVPIRMPITTIAPVFHRAREPIVPGIYDAIAANPDDPSIVRYAMTTREISAASPARIIAQITSKNFLDYELLSDFFLTVRAYLSTKDLLSYLLARFEWAINRFDDDGRVIRVRAFAAIRHWVLNYFPYDFVVDRDLRVKFCEHLNALARHVRVRGHEASDLKLIIDLKKCWNGRCALYWDNLQDENDGRNDLDIGPGGIVGSRDSQLTHPNELWAKLATTSSHQLDQERSVAALHNWVDSVIEAEVDGRSKSERQTSTTSHAHPTSALSDQSIPAMSCSIPGKTLKVFTNQAGRIPGPRPVPSVVPSGPRRACPPAPSSQTKEKVTRNKVDHQRSGSFSDALRDKRTSLGAIQEGKSSEQVVMSLPFSGSLIRGSVLPPGSPFIDNLSPHGSGSSLSKQGHYCSIPTDKLTARPMSPGVRNLLSNIRRAWGSKQSSIPPPPTLLPAAPFMVETKHSALPMHIAYKIEGFGDQHHQLEALKKNARIDLLCADVTEMFERAMTRASNEQVPPADAIRLTSGNERELPCPNPWQSPKTTEREKLRRNHSEVTTGSRSIVIVDDTSPKPPIPHIPASFHRSGEGQDFYKMAGSAGEPPSTVLDPVISAKTPNPGAQIEGDTALSELLPEFIAPNLRSSQGHDDVDENDTSTAGMSSLKDNYSSPTGTSFRFPRSGSVSLRKYVSYQSGMRRSGPDHSIENTNTINFPAGSFPHQTDKPPSRMLRRRPGGDLRANQNVHEMEPIPRPRSTGSIATYRDSLHNSAVFLKSVARNTADSGSTVAAEPDQGDSTPVRRKSLSLVHSRSSHKDLRPSFELAVAEFARIPDGDGGDLEATLLKLEGKFKRSPVGSPEGLSSAKGRSFESQSPILAEPSSNSPKPRVLEPESGSQESALTPAASAGKIEPRSQARLDAASYGQQQRTTHSLYTESEESYNSLPLLERGIPGRNGPKAEAVPDQSNVAMPPPLFSPNDPYGQDSGVTSNRASEDLDSVSRVRRGRYRSSIPTVTTDSFLLDEDEFLSDLSSELSEEDGGNSVFRDAQGTSAPSIPAQPLPSSVGYASGYLPSPPMTTENDMAISSEAMKIQEHRKPPTPEPSPVSRLVDSLKSRTADQVDSSVLQPFANKVHQFPPRRHIPFVLAFDATVLAQQFTLIERDALNEINWQDLIDLRWQQTSPGALNWVEYLRFQDPNGIDLVTARFNIVVKWALSEIVLTHNVEERALTVMTYIRIAQDARKYHNYATLLQLTIALTSMDCKRLTKTWALVPEAEKAAMKEMESLVSPLRNFHNLRAEMEAANLDDGCIPVVALFLHDLTYNAQKPSVIASTRDAEPLINFERYRTTATIVKSLLRLIDASAKYDFKPVEGALERCLWMASLSDEGIRTKSKELEPFRHLIYLIFPDDEENGSPTRLIAQYNTPLDGLCASAPTPCTTVAKTMEIQALLPSAAIPPIPASFTSARKDSLPAAEIDPTFAFTSIDLLSAPLGARILSFSDQFFAEASNLINPNLPIQRPGVFVETGAWYDGWETRRHNPSPADYVLIRLGPAAGVPIGVEIDTAFFNGNHAEHISVLGAYETGEDADETVKSAGYNGWGSLLGKRKCGPSSRHAWFVESRDTVTHVKLEMWPDGGIARFRLYGNAVPVWPSDPTEEVELSAANMGGIIV
ncbi:MAG: hypothetical protein Q9163_003441, partial [Psora crenata]